MRRTIVNKALVVAAIAALVAAASSVEAGVYLGQSSRPIHPGFAYQGVGGRVDIPLCPTQQMYVATRNVAAKYNRRADGLDNVARPGDPEFPPAGALSVEHLLLHELGHAVGLDHPSEEVVSIGGSAQHQGIAPAGRGPNGVLDAAPGPDGIYGTEDDVRGDDVNRTPFPVGGENSPFEVPAIVDDLSMTTDLSRRARPGTWPLVPWVPVSRSLGLPDTQSVMMTAISDVRARPSPDEITLLKWSEAGAEGLAGTEDDYSLFFYVVAPDDPRPPECISVAMGHIDSSAGGITRFNRPFMGSAISNCFGSALCVVSSSLVLNDRYTWHFPSSDTSNGEADFIPLEPSDAVFTSVEQVEVNLGIRKTVPVQIARQGGVAFPPGTRMTVTWTNGVVREMRVAGQSASIFDYDLSGLTVLDAELAVEGDETPSSGAVFVNVFIPNRDVARGRITLVDLAETVVLDFVPARVQLNTTGISDSFPGLTRQWDVRLSTSATRTPLSGVETGFALRPDLMFGPCQDVGAGNNIALFGPSFVDDQTDTDGRATASVEYTRYGANPDAQLNAECRFIHTLSTGQEIDGFVTVTTDQVLGTLTPDRAGVTLRSVAQGQQENFVLATLDQLGMAMAEGFELEASCSAPEANEVQFAPVGVPTTNAAGQATLTIEASTADGSAFTEEVTCTVGAHGVVQAITIAPVLPASIEVSPESVYILAAEHVAGAEIEVEATLRDSMGDLMADIPVTLSCVQPLDPGNTQIAPVMPGTRNTDAQGIATLTAAIAFVGVQGFSTPVECTVTSGNLSSTLMIEGQPFGIFESGFED
jgi:hypothetical protein